MVKPKVSIIIRTKDEERWIASCLRGIKQQSFEDYEIIIVDNKSKDGTIFKAKQFPVKIISIIDYTPGKALNKGIKNSRGEYLAFISGHCIPASSEWLQKLIDGFIDENVAGARTNEL